MKIIFDNKNEERIFFNNLRYAEDNGTCLSIKGRECPEGTDGEYLSCVDCIKQQIEWEIMGEDNNENYI